MASFVGYGASGSVEVGGVFAGGSRTAPWAERLVNRSFGIRLLDQGNILVHLAKTRAELCKLEGEGSEHV